MAKHNKRNRRNNRYPDRKQKQTSWKAKFGRRDFYTEAGTQVRSGLELKVCNALEKQGVEYEYEPERFEWHDYLPRARCGECGTKGASYTIRTYTPDLKLSNGTWIEVKGRLTARDRKILTGVRERNPDLDLRIVFGPDNKIATNSKTRYSDWATKNGFLHGFGGVVPNAWLVNNTQDGSQ